MRLCSVYIVRSQTFLRRFLRFLFFFLILLLFHQQQHNTKHNKSLLVVISPDHTFISLLRRISFLFRCHITYDLVSTAGFCNVNFVSLLIAFRRPQSLALPRSALEYFWVWSLWGGNCCEIRLKFIGNARKLDAFDTLGDLKNLHKRKILFSFEYIILNKWLGIFDNFSLFKYDSKNFQKPRPNLSD